MVKFIRSRLVIRTFGTKRVGRTNERVFGRAITMITKKFGKTGSEDGTIVPRGSTLKRASGERWCFFLV